MLALARRNIATLGWVRMQRTMRPSMRLGLRLRVRRPARLVSLRGRRTRIVRRLRRQVELDAQFRVFLPQRRVLGLQHLQAHPSDRSAARSKSESARLSRRYREGPNQETESSIG